MKRSGQYGAATEHKHRERKRVAVEGGGDFEGGSEEEGGGGG